MGSDHALTSWLAWLEPRIGTEVEIGPPEIIGRASGLRRPGMIALFHWPAMGTRLGVGLEVPLAHTVVDRLLGYDRPLSETRLQLTPVEWGVWTYLVVRVLDEHLPSRPHNGGARDRSTGLAARCPGPTPRPRRPGPVRPGRPGPDRDPEMARPRRFDRGLSASLASRVGCSSSYPRCSPARQHRAERPTPSTWRMVLPLACRGRLRDDAQGSRTAPDRRGLAPDRLAARGPAAEPDRADRPGMRPDRRGWAIRSSRPSRWTGPGDGS